MMEAAMLDGLDSNADLDSVRLQDVQQPAAAATAPAAPAAAALAAPAAAIAAAGAAVALHGSRSRSTGSAEHDKNNSNNTTRPPNSHMDSNISLDSVALSQPLARQQQPGSIGLASQHSVPHTAGPATTTTTYSQARDILSAAAFLDAEASGELSSGRIHSPLPAAAAAATAAVAAARSATPPSHQAAASGPGPASGQQRYLTRTSAALEAAASPGPAELLLSASITRLAIRTGSNASLPSVNLGRGVSPDPEQAAGAVDAAASTLSHIPEDDHLAELFTPRTAANYQLLRDASQAHLLEMHQGLASQAQVAEQQLEGLQRLHHGLQGFRRASQEQLASLRASRQLQLAAQAEALAGLGMPVPIAESKEGQQGDEELQQALRRQQSNSSWQDVALSNNMLRSPRKASASWKPAQQQPAQQAASGALKQPPPLPLPPAISVRATSALPELPSGPLPSSQLKELNALRQLQSDEQLGDLPDSAITPRSTTMTSAEQFALLPPVSAAVFAYVSLRSMVELGTAMWLAFKSGLDDSAMEPPSDVLSFWVGLWQGQYSCRWVLGWQASPGGACCCR
jgi:hypothetical protein